ncbi:unnamed protein product, partial [Prorocentrum cordatum]
MRGAMTRVQSGVSLYRGNIRKLSNNSLGTILALFYSLMRTACTSAARHRCPPAAKAAAELAALVRADLRSELAAVLDAQGGAARLQGSPRPACVRARPLDGHDSAPDFQAHQPKGPARFADELSDGASDASPARARAAAGKGAAGAAPAALADLAHVPPGELASLSSRTASGWLSGLQRRSEQPLVGSSEGPNFRVSFVHAFSRAKIGMASIGLTPIAEERRLRAAAVLLRLFDSSACAVLLLNLVFIGAETEYNARGGGSEQGEVAFQAAEVCFLAFFLTDLLRRYCQDRKDFFRGGMWRWNVFEAALVTVQFLDVMVQFSLGTSKEREQTRSTGRMVISLMRFLRLARVLRVLRLFQFLQELNKLIWLIYASLRAFIWTVVLLVTMTYMFGVFLTQLVVDCTSDNPEWNGEFGDELSTYYSSVGSSVLYLFAATSGGIDWSSLLVPLKGVAEEAAGVVVLLFLLYITFTVMVVMNLVTGVFVEGAKRLNETERESLLCRRMKEIFEIATPSGLRRRRGHLPGAVPQPAGQPLHDRASRHLRHRSAAGREPLHAAGPRRDEHAHRGGVRQGRPAPEGPRQGLRRGGTAARGEAERQLAQRARGRRGGARAAPGGRRGPRARCPRRALPGPALRAEPGGVGEHACGQPELSRELAVCASLALARSLSLSWSTSHHLSLSLSLSSSPLLSPRLPSPRPGQPSRPPQPRRSLGRLASAGDPFALGAPPGGGWTRAPVHWGFSSLLEYSRGPEEGTFFVG